MNDYISRISRFIVLGILFVLKPARAEDNAGLTQLLSIKMGNVSITPTTEGLTINSAKDGRVLTNQSYAVPVRMDAVAKTDSTNVRLYFGTRGLVIFNWELKPDELRYRDPVDESEKHQPGKGRIPVNQWVTFTWIVSENASRLLVDGEERATIPGKYTGIYSPFGIGPGVGSTIQIKSLKISDGAGQILADTSTLTGAPRQSMEAKPSSPPAAPIINSKKLSLPENRKLQAADLLTSYAKANAASTEKNRLALIQKMLSIALTLEPEDRTALVLSVRLQHGEIMPSGSNADSIKSSVETIEGLTAIAKQAQGGPGRDDRLLAAHIWIIILGLDPSNDEAVYQSEILRRAGITPDANWISGVKKPQ